jgi:ABC-type multidrug transport system fused ATPase/permease subunit
VETVSLLRDVWYILDQREKIEGSILLCYMAVGALLEAVSISLLVPFIAILNQPELIMKIPAARTLFSLLDIHEPRRMLIAMGVGLIGIFIVKSGFLLYLYRWQSRYVFSVHARLGGQLLSDYLNAPYSFHLQRNSSELIKATTESVQRFTAGFLLGLLTVLGEILVVLAITTVLLLIEPLTTLGAIVILGVPTALIYLSTQHRLARAGRVAEQSFSSIIQWTTQALNSVKETLVADRASFFTGLHGYHMRRVASSMATFMFLSAVPRVIIDTLAVSTMVIVVLFVLVRGQDITEILPALTMFAAAAIRLMPSTSRIANGVAQLRFHSASTKVICRELSESRKAAAAHRRGSLKNQDALPLRFRHSLVLDHLSYSYPCMPRPAVDNVSIEIHKGEWISFIGPTGAGKTTLVDLILGLFVPTSGQISVDGRDLQSDVSAWQRGIGYVPQDVFLLDDTIRRNVAFGMKDEDIDDDRLWHALESAQVDILVKALPGGLDAVTGEHGARLSGGERQRLGLARALYRKPEVLVIDEGTAHLDNETEAAIIRTLCALRGSTTIVVIAHRLAVVRDCDRIYMLKQGRVYKSGTYKELLSTDPTFLEPLTVH